MMLIMIALYFIGITMLGTILAKKETQKSMKEFALAGKGLTSFVLIGTFISTWLGGGTITGSVNSLAYNFGIGPAITYVLPSVLATVVLYIMGPIVRRKGKMTIAALLEESYGREARMVSAVIIALACFSIVSFQYRGLGIVMNATTGINVDLATAIGCIIIILLSFVGGLKTVALTDAISAVLMAIGLAISVPFVLSAVGGLDNVIAVASKEFPHTLTFTGGWDFKTYMLYFLPAFLLGLGDQNLYQRMAAAKDDKNVQIGMIGWGIGTVVVLPIIAVLGFLGRIYFGSNIMASQSMIGTSTLCPWVIGGIMMAAASAFIITTADSYLLSGATNIAVDVYAHFNQKATDADQLKITRWSIVIFGILSLGILKFFPSILAVQFWSYTVVGAGITPSLLGCVLCPEKVTKWGGLASMIGGTVLTIGWELAKHPYGIATIFVAFPASMVLLVLVSACTNKK